MDLGKQRLYQGVAQALERRGPAAARTAMRDHFHRSFETMPPAREDAVPAELRRAPGENRQRFPQATAI